MALSFTDAEKASLGEILDANHVEIAEHVEMLEALSTPLPSAVETKVSADIVLWDSYKDKHIKTEANLKNFGADRDVERNREAIRCRVAKHLIWTRDIGSGQTTLVRG